MFEHKKIQELNDFFVDINSRKSKGVYFYRINSYTEEINQFIQKYYEAARICGVIIEGRIPNPTEKNLSYYDEVMGMDFQMSTGFISASLKKWLPRMNDYQRQNVAVSIYDSLNSMQKTGKNLNMLKNAYIKFMCWLYYKFERIVNQLGQNKVPKILYEGDISKYELMLISILSNAGCDVIFLQYQGDANYLKLDPQSVLSENMIISGGRPFPSNFNLRQVREEIQNHLNTERLYGKKTQIVNCTNTWVTGNGFDDIRKGFSERGNSSNCFYNCYCRINGVEDKLTYTNELFQFQMQLKTSKRNLVIVEENIPKPTPEEVASIRRGNYAKQDQMIQDLSQNIRYPSSEELQRLMVKSFVNVMLEEGKKKENSLNKLVNKAVYLLCWLKRYQSMLFSNWKMPQVSCFIYLGGCKNENEVLFLKFLVEMPIDILILNPNLNAKCCLSDSRLYEINYENSLVVDKYPKENANVHIGTAAYHAERELDTLMYQDTGMYRNQQYAKANAITLQTIYEEIKILWKEELKYRPNFSTINDMVNIPVIFSKVCGIKDGMVIPYWASIKELITEDTFVVKKVPWIESTAHNPMKAHATDFLRYGKLQIAKIKAHASYPYTFLREEIQNYMLEKLQMLIDSKDIKGTFQNGTEYTIVSVILNLPKDIVRMIQKFDFTKKNPKLIYINTGEQIISLEDSIIVAYLNLIGFDIVFFVPTGYQSIERHFNRKMMEEHQIGDYVYDLQVPDFRTVAATTKKPTWRDKILKRGTYIWD